LAGSRAFRTAVAPAYLRRNQEDVLTELPDLIKADEWLEFKGPDLASYRAAVIDGNFMAMRRAAFEPADPRGSAKLQRLLEIVAESADNGRKVLIFSYFRAVLAAIHNALDSHVFGPLTGSVAPPERQRTVDAFGQATGHAVLLSQIQAGGVGLNIQSASVVLLCEPQVKPTLEDQAVARVHRIGQVRKVQVHRLLVADSVDQRMLEILAHKAQLFHEYARQSDVAAASPDAVDISDGDLARRIVEMEQERHAEEAIRGHRATGAGTHAS
jgi:SNF2 family DNA or RNA helicase